MDEELEKKRYELLRFTYDEVLAATKHQDEKINKLLTAVAFLVAGSLALANLADAKFAMRGFALSEGTSVPLAMFTVGVFLVGVLAAVLMLIGTMTSPLRFPGGSRADAPDIEYVTSFRAGQVYFNEIASGSLAEWYGKWAVKDAAALLFERNESLVRETHNLAVRAESKYTRTTEAVAVLSFALLSFALSVVLLVRAAADPLPASGTSPADAVTVDWPLRTLLALVLLGYCWLQLRGSARGEFQSVADLAPEPPPEDDAHRPPARPLQAWVRTAAHPLAVALVPAWLAFAPPAHWIGALVALVLPLLAFALLRRALPEPDTDADAVMARVRRVESGVSMPPDEQAKEQARLDERREEMSKRRRSVLGWAGPVAVGYALVGAGVVFAGWYPVQLVLAFAGAAGLLVAALAATTTRQRRRVLRYAKRRNTALAEQARPVPEPVPAVRP
ncbi:hypothetical protein [Geodermatophilus sp. CPCC 206100]|uniref:hypothetical protein n=1 Tax=Geodermatophilus sp. CPCC 206100 TaxID=3020054 RepID=UPI003B00A4D5